MLTKKLSKVTTVGLQVIGAVVSREAEKVLFPSPRVGSEISQATSGVDLRALMWKSV